MIGLMFICVSSLIFKPYQIHLSLTESPNTLRVTWVTWTNSQPIVKYREETSTTVTTVKASSKQFYPGQQAKWFHWIHTAEMTNLSEYATYIYQVGTESMISEEYKFIGLTAKTFTIKRPLKFCIFGDLDSTENGLHSIKLLENLAEAHHIDLVVHLGDIAYSLDTNEGIHGDEFLNQIQPITARVPYMTLIGNHELDYNNQTQFKNRFKHPINEANEGTNLFYSFDFGMTHFIVFNSAELIYGSPGINFETEMNWLTKHLEDLEERRGEIPWLFFCTHIAVYCSVDWREKEPDDEFYECLEEAETLRGHVEELLYEYEIDIVFEGHLHNYERDSPIYRNLTVVDERDDKNHFYSPEAPVYLVGGIAGNYMGNNDPIPSTPALWANSFTKEFSIGKLTVFNESVVLWEQINSSSQEIIDYFYIYK